MNMLLPMLAMMLITFVVWLLLLFRRVTDSRNNNINIEDVATPDQASEAFGEKTNAVSNCFKNMFELPVVFYAISCLLIFTGAVDQLYVNLAWGFVALRAVQMIVHCSYNRVLHRFIAYLTSSIMLWAMVFRFTIAFV